MKKRHKNRDKNNTWLIYLITILISIRLRQYLFVISKVFLKKYLSFNFIYFKLLYFVFSDHCDMLILKIILKNKKIYYFDVFLS
jgi:hypothetical protein